MTAAVFRLETPEGRGPFSLMPGRGGLFLTPGNSGYQDADGRFWRIPRHTPARQPSPCSDPVLQRSMVALGYDVRFLSGSAWLFGCQSFDDLRIWFGQALGPMVAGHYRVMRREVRRVAVGTNQVAYMEHEILCERDVSALVDHAEH